MNKIQACQQAQKQPVSLINDLAKGKEKMAKLRLDRDIEETNYSVCIEGTRNLRIELEEYRSFLTCKKLE